MFDASAPSDPAPAKPLRPSEGIAYMRSLHYIFENPNWITNVLFLGLCALTALVVPVIGQLIVQGYQFSIIEAMHQRPGSSYPDFDMNKMIDYLLRGFWVFLVRLVLWLPVVVGLGTLFAIVVMSAVRTAGDEEAAATIMVVASIFYCVFQAVKIAINIVFLPFTLRAGLTQDFGASFDFGFAMQFIRNTWKELILCTLFFTVAGMLLAVIGTALLCVGTFFTMSIAALVQAHLTLQLYELHLARGGDVIAIPVDSPPL